MYRNNLVGLYLIYSLLYHIVIHNKIEMVFFFLLMIDMHWMCECVQSKYKGHKGKRLDSYISFYYLIYTSITISCGILVRLRKEENNP